MTIDLLGGIDNESVGLDYLLSFVFNPDACLTDAGLRTPYSPTSESFDDE